MTSVSQRSVDMAAITERIAQMEVNFNARLTMQQSTHDAKTQTLLSELSTAQRVHHHMQAEVQQAQQISLAECAKAQHANAGSATLQHELNESLHARQRIAEENASSASAASQLHHALQAAEEQHAFVLRRSLTEADERYANTITEYRTELHEALTRAQPTLEAGSAPTPTPCPECPRKQACIHTLEARLHESELARNTMQTQVDDLTRSEADTRHLADHFRMQEGDARDDFTRQLQKANNDHQEREAELNRHASCLSEELEKVKLQLSTATRPTDDVRRLELDLATATSKNEMLASQLATMERLLGNMQAQQTLTRKALTMPPSRTHSHASPSQPQMFSMNGGSTDDGDAADDPDDPPKTKFTMTQTQPPLTLTTTNGDAAS